MGTPIRLSDVARSAGVSLATASRVLNGSSRTPRPEVAARVREAAERLGYVPNAQAQALARSSAGLVGLIVHDIADPYFSSIAKGAQKALGEAGIQLMLAITDRDPEAGHAAVQRFMSYRTDGIIVTGSRGFGGEEQLARLFDAYRDVGGHVAMVGQPFPGTSGVQIANREGGAALAGELIKLGYREFVVVAGQSWLVTSQDRVEGFRDKLVSSGVPTGPVVEGAFTRDGGYVMMADLLRRDGRFSPDMPPVPVEERLCVFCVTDVMALGALSAIRDAGLRVPDHLAVAGFDDIPNLLDHWPAVTTVHLPLEEIGRLGAEVVIGDSDRRFVVGGQPVLRESTRP